MSLIETIAFVQEIEAPAAGIAATIRDQKCVNVHAKASILTTSRLGARRFFSHFCQTQIRRKNHESAKRSFFRCY
jgi:hypothetical protein